jgi:hypothetical protein
VLIALNSGGLLSRDVFQDFLNDVRTGDIGDHAQPTAAVRADRQIDRECPVLAT